MIQTTFGNFGTGTIDQIIHELTRTRGGVQTHALLGDIAFNLITYFEGVEESFSGNYAEHALIEGKPRLQYVGDNLDEVRWDLVFHAGFCVPDIELLKLRAAVASHKALPLVLANGDYKGLFVPVDASVTTRQAMRDGTVIWVEASLTLREYVAPAVLAEETAKQEPTAVEKNGRPPSGAVEAAPAPRSDSAKPTRTAR
jgi:phage protein U